MADLNPSQLRVAQQVYGAARGAGLNHQQALEVVAAAYAESGLNPNATNKSSGAAGLFQLLSPGYRQAAQSRGGLYNPGANEAAILPSYVNFFRSHPGAAPGEAGAAVERSGQGPGFYSTPLSKLAGIGGGGAGAMPVMQQPGATAQPGLAAFGQKLISAIGSRSSSGLISALEGLHAAGGGGAAAAAPLNFGSLSGSPGKVNPALIGLAHHFGLSITSGYRSEAQNSSVGGSPTSLHMKGLAIDVKPTQNAERLAAYARQNPGQFVEFFGPVPWYIKNGQIHSGQFPGHGDHFHIALAPSA